MPTTKLLHDRAVVHRVWLGRYSNWLLRRVVAQLARVDADVVAKVASSRGTTQAAQATLLAGLRAVQEAGWALIAERVTEGLEGLAGVENDFQRQLLAMAMGQLGIDLGGEAVALVNVIAAVKARPFQGKLLREWLKDAEDASVRRVREAIRQGFAESETIDQMVRRLRGTQKAGYKDGILDISRRGAEALVRTAVTHTANVAAHENYRAAGSVVEGVEWVSTLDGRTTLICAGRDGKVFPLESGPRPPAHIACRSTTIPRLAGMTPFKRTTYQDWIAGLPAKTQQEILGPSRYALFAKGGVRLDKFVDNYGHTLNLDQLRRKDADAFALAGID